MTFISNHSDSIMYISARITATTPNEKFFQWNSELKISGNVLAFALTLILFVNQRQKIFSRDTNHLALTCGLLYHFNYEKCQRFSSNSLPALTTNGIFFQHFCSTFAPDEKFINFFLTLHRLLLHKFLLHDMKKHNWTIFFLSFCLQSCMENINWIKPEKLHLALLNGEITMTRHESISHCHDVSRTAQRSR